MAGRGGERLRLDGPREAAQVTVGRPGFESSSRGWVHRLGQVSPSVSRLVMVVVTITGTRAVLCDQ